MNYILIKILLSNEYFLKYYKYIDLNYYKDNSKEIYKILLCLNLLLEKGNRDFSVEELEVYFFTQYPHLKMDDRILYDAIFSKLKETTYDEALVSEYLEKQRYQTEAAKLALIAYDVSQGKTEWGTVSNYFQQVNELQPIDEDIQFVSDDLEELYNDTVLSQGLRWRLTSLNKIFGSLRKGNFGFVFARPEVGKTTFLASEISYMAGQTDRPIVWFNNEEQGSKVNLRCYQATLGCSHKELFQDLTGNREEFYALTKRNIKLYDDASITKKTVEKVCQQIQPAMIIFDQIDKIYGFEAERNDLKLKTIYQWARELAKTYGPVIGVCQAGGTAEGKKYLAMTDVDSSHTAKQGEADWMLGIGSTNNEGDEYVRYLSACKNKLDGDVDTIPELRHGKVSVLIHPEIARYSDSMVWN